MIRRIVARPVARASRPRVPFLALAALCAAHNLALADAPPAPLTLQFLAESGLPARIDSDPRRVGGLSGLAYRASDDRWFAVSDDKEDPRIYTLRIALRPAQAGEAQPTIACQIESVSHLPRPIDDAEALAFEPTGSLLIGCERPAGVWRLDIDPAHAAPLAFRNPRALPLRDKMPAAVRINRGFESVAVLQRDGRTEIWGATESALTTDGEEASSQTGALCRVVVWDAHTALRIREHAYLTLPAPPSLPLAPKYNSLAELAALPDGTLLALERSFSIRRGFDAAIRRVVPGRAETNIADAPRASDVEGLQPLSADTLASIVALGATPAANYEGLALGPPLPDGGRLLILLADDNFGSDGQPVNRVLALRLGAPNP